MIHDKILYIRKINNEISKSNITFITGQTKAAQVHVCFVLLLFVCIFAYAHVYSKTICARVIKSICIGPKFIAGVPLSQAAPAYLITAHHLCAFLVYFSRWLCGGFQQKINKYQTLFFCSSLTNPPPLHWLLYSHMKYPLVQSLSRFTETGFVHSKRNHFFFCRRVLTISIQPQSTRGYGHLSRPGSQCLWTGLLNARLTLAGRQRRLTGHKYLCNKLSYRDVSFCRFFL